jgi:uncharacterized protein with von Willebrand factor type A (vWA) domain
VEFCRRLRLEGLTVTPSETIDAISILPLIDLSRKDEFHDGLRSVLIKRPDDYSVFDRVFEAFWRSRRGQEDGTQSGTQETEAASRGEAEKKIRDGKTRRRQDSDSPPQRKLGEVLDLFPPAGRPPSERILTAYSAVERLGRREFPNLSLSEVPQIRRGLRRLARRLATRPGRRMIRSNKGELDFDATIRKSLQTGGAIIRPQKRERAISRSRLVVLCDVSGSMDFHSTRLLKVLHLAQNTVPDARVFAFSTGLTRMERYLRGRSLRNAAREVSRNVEIWSSGTRIGAALGRLLREYSADLRADTVVVIISDGWEVGELEVLDENLAKMRRRVSKIVWLNPLADDPGYLPKTLGMQTALPYVDLFSGLNILSDRREFRRILGRNIGGVISRAAPRAVRRGSGSPSDRRSNM